MVALKAFCGGFMEVLGRGEAEEKVLNALVALKKVVKGCEATGEFREWLEKGRGDEEVLAEARELFYVGKEL